jgi:hypothetical protein
MLYVIEDWTRGETFTTDHKDNAWRFYIRRMQDHPDHTVQLWLTDEHGVYTMMLAGGGRDVR